MLLCLSYHKIVKSSHIWIFSKYHLLFAKHYCYLIEVCVGSESDAGWNLNKSRHAQLHINRRLNILYKLKARVKHRYIVKLQNKVSYQSTKAMSNESRWCFRYMGVCGTVHCSHDDHNWCKVSAILSQCKALWTCRA